MHVLFTELHRSLTNPKVLNITGSKREGDSGLNNQLMFALLLLIHRSHNTTTEGITRAGLFEEASSPLDTGQTLGCQTLSIACDKPLQVSDCSHLLSVIGSKGRVRLFSTLSARSVKLAASARTTADRTLFNPTDVFFCPHWKYFCFPTANCFLKKGISPHTSPRLLEQEFQSEDWIITDPDPVASRTTSRSRPKNQTERSLL